MGRRDEVDEAERLARFYGEFDASERPRRFDPANPGNRAILAERMARTRALLRSAGLGDLSGRRVLEIGCGAGGELARMRELDAEPSGLLGVDLLPARVERARREHPELEFRIGDASRLELPDASFDLVLTMTVLSSVLDDAMARRIAGEIVRVLRPGGALLWYDLRVGNPRRPGVHGVPARAVRDLFPDLRGPVHRLTLVPPLARRLGRLTPVAYPALAAMPFLRTHLLALLIKR